MRKGFSKSVEFFLYNIERDEGVKEKLYTRFVMSKLIRSSQRKS